MPNQEEDKAWLKEAMSTPINKAASEKPAETTTKDILRQSMESDFVDDSGRTEISLDKPTFGRFLPTNTDYLGGIEASQIGDIDQIRGQRQSNWVAAGNAAARIIPKIGLGIVQQSGYLLDMESHYKTISGEGGDYSNILTRFAEKGQAMFDEALPVYRENPNEVFDTGDPAWWISHGEGLIKSIGEFAIVGAGVGGVLSKGAKGLASVLTGSSKVMGAAAKAGVGAVELGRALEGGAQLGTSMALAYAEGAMTGADVYKKVYAESMEKFPGDVDRAKAAAGEAAATTVRLNTIINTGLNLSSTRTFMRDMRSGNKLGSQWKQQPGELTKNWKKRLKADPDLMAAKKEAMKSLGFETIQEGAEEVVNEIASGLGEYRGKELLETLSDDELAQGRTGKIFEILGQDQTHLAAILGMVGGAGQQTVTSMFPNAKKQKQQKRDYEQSQKEHLIKNIDNFESAQEKIAKAKEKGDKNMFNEGMDELFGQQAFNSFVTGTSGHVEQMYDEIANLTPEQAAEQGYSIEDGPDNYKTRAEEAKKDIKELSKLYEETIYRHNNFDDDAKASFYGERVFEHLLAKKGLEKGIDRATKDLNDNKDKHTKQAERRGITDYTLHEAMLLEARWEADKKILENVQNDIDVVNAMDGRTTSSREQLRVKYGNPPRKYKGKRKSLKQHALDQIAANAKKAQIRSKKALAKVNKARKEHKDAGNDPKDFDEAVAYNSFEKQNIIENEAYLERAKENLLMADKAYTEITSDEGKADHIKEHSKRAKASETNKKATDDKTKDNAEVKGSKNKKQETKEKVKEKRKEDGEVSVEEAGVETPVAGVTESAEADSKSEVQTETTTTPGETVEETKEKKEEFSSEEEASIEAKKADIEKRRQEELDKNDNLIVEKVEDYEATNDEGETIFIQIRTMVDGSQLMVWGDEKNKYGNTTQLKDKLAKGYDFNKSPESYFDQDTFGAVSKVGERTPEEANLVGRKNKINAKYDAELAALEGKTEETTSKEFSSEEEVGEGIADDQVADQPDREFKDVEDGDTRSALNEGKKEILEGYDTNDDTQEDRSDEKTSSTSDMLVVPAGNSFAYLSKEYVVINGLKVSTNEKNKTLTKELESSKMFKPGTKLTLELDSDAVWTEKDEDGVEMTYSYKDFLNDDKTPIVENVPIVIKDEDGNKIAHVRTQDWILRNNKGVYKNVASHSYDANNPIYKNAEKQAALNMKIREAVVKNGSVKTTIIKKGAGQLSLNMVDGKRGTQKPLAEATPKLNTLVVVRRGTPHVGKKQVANYNWMNKPEFMEDLYKFEGMVFLPIPAPNGKTLLVPAYSPPISPKQANTLMTLLDAFYTNDEAQIKEIEERLGIDLSSPKAVSNYINSITYAASDSEQSFEKKIDAEGNAKIAHMSFDSESKFAAAGKTTIRFATQGRGATVIKNKEQFDEHREVLAEFLLKKLFSVNINAINKDNEIAEISTNEDGELIKIKHNTYNDYAKKYVQTDILAHEINETEDSYFDNPVIEFDANEAIDGEKTVEEEAQDGPPEGFTPPPITEVDDRVESEVEKTTEESAESEQDMMTTFLMASGEIEYLDENKKPCKP